jgi:hypothetical protein
MKANECGHIVEAFQFMCSCEDGVIRNLTLVPLICETCRIMREASSLASPVGSRVIGFSVNSYEGQKPKWRTQLLELDATYRQKIESEVSVAWPSSRDDVVRGRAN